MNAVKSWTFYWRDGLREVLTGESAADALNRKGYGAGAMRALDFFTEGDQDGVWEWRPDARTWVRG